MGQTKPVGKKVEAARATVTVDTPVEAAETTERRIKALIYGPQGQGKSTFLGTAALDPRTAALAYLDFEGGSEVLHGLPGPHEIFHIRSWDDYKAVFDILQDNPGRKCATNPDALPFKSVGFDSLSETHLFALFQILDAEVANRRDPDLLQQQDYGKAMVQMRRLVRAFRDLPLHVFFVASAKDVADPREGMVKKPAMSGQLADDIPGLMSVVSYLAITEDNDGKPVRQLLLQNYPKVRTKARTPWGVVCPDEIEVASVTALLNTLQYND